MAENFLNTNEGSGKKLHTWNRTIGANDVHDEFVLPGEFVYASYTVRFHNISTATANDHIVAIWAGSSLNVRIRHIFLEQHNLAGTATATPFELLRTNTTPSGGTAITMGKMDSADATAGFSAASLPSTKGTETGVALLGWSIELLAAVPRALHQIEWSQHPGMKPIIIPAGTTNGIALKVISAVATASVSGFIECVETNFV